MKSMAEWVEILELIRHPEGGYFREVYRSSETIPRSGLPNRYDGPRAFSTCILFLLPGNEISCFHRLRSDEIWHFYEGSELGLFMIDRQGELREVRLGPDAEAGQVRLAVVPAESWFGAAVKDPESYALLACAVAPGFDWADFEVGKRGLLQTLYPQHHSIIEMLTRP